MFRKYLSYNHHANLEVSRFFDLIRYYSKWLKYKKPPRRAIDDQLPWIIFEALDFLKKNLKPNMRIFEFGSGGSTLFFAKYVEQIVSVEHDKEWFDLVKQRVNANGLKNFIGLLHPPTPIKSNDEPKFADPDRYLSADENFLNSFSFFDYASSIDQFNDNYFDLISIDGRARPSCIKHAIPKLKINGLLMLDNSDRDYYVQFLSTELSQLDKVFEKFGPGPYNEMFWGTTFYKKK